MQTNFEKNLQLFEFRKDSFFWVKDKDKAPTTVRFYLEEAEILNVDAVYFRKCTQNPANQVPFIYIYNHSDSKHSYDLGELCRKNWNAGNVPFTFVFDNRQTVILNNMQMPEIDSETNKPKAIPFDTINFASNINDEIDAKLKKYSAKLFDTGSFWHAENIKNNFQRSGGSYELLLKNLKDFREIIIKQASQKIERENLPSKKHEAFIEKTIVFINKLIVLCIFVKYLEEKGEGDDKVFQEGFFERFKYNCFCETLRDSEATVKLFAFLSQKFNGRVFALHDDEHSLIEYIDIGIIADFLDGCVDNIFQDKDDSIYYQNSFWRLYSFKELNIEFMSNLYEEFVIEDEEKNENGVVYTPHHLVQFIIDEVMPIDSPPKELKSFRILDPACGSGIFLVGAFKRLIQWWRIENNWQKPSAEELIKIITNSIHGVDKSGNALKVAVFSLYLSVCDNLTPKMIWEDLTFENLLERNFIESDFFDTNISGFDIILGNPPFDRNRTNWTGSAQNVDDSLYHTDKNLKTLEAGDDEQPYNELQRPHAPDLAMVFFEESMYRLKHNGCISLVMPASSLLYNKKAKKYRSYLLSNFNIPQIVDFTHLNRTLFEGRGDISTCVLFGSNDCVNLPGEILHIVVKRTKPAKEKIYFEIDYYDFHYIALDDAIYNEFIWKANYWGGGRLCLFVDRFSKYGTLKDYIRNNSWKYEGGLRYSKLHMTNGDNRKNLMGAYNLTPPKLLSGNGIDYEKLPTIDEELYVNPSKGQLFSPPTILIRLVIEDESQKIPLAFNSDKTIYFGERVIGISCANREKHKLKNFYNRLSANIDYMKLYIALTSYDFSTGTSSALTKADIDNLPWVEDIGDNFKLNEVDEVYLEDIFTYVLPLKREGELSIALNEVDENDLSLYAKWFCNILNSIYDDDSNFFRAGEPLVHGAIVCHQFYLGNTARSYSGNINESKINALIESEYESLIIKKLVKYYDNNTIVIIKPNEKRYWLRSIAIRDADDTVNEFIRQGF